MIVSNTKIGKGIQIQIILGLGKLGFFYFSKKHKSEPRAHFLYEWYYCNITAFQLYYGDINQFSKLYVVEREEIHLIM